MTVSRDRWPALPLAAWQDTYDTLHMYAQVVGKVRIASTPRTNQLWNSALALSARGLTTGAMPCPGGTFELKLDLVAHQLQITTSMGATRTLMLGGPVQAFYHGVMETLEDMGIPMTIWPQPVEVPDPIRFDRDDRHTYDPEAVTRLLAVLARVGPVFENFRARFRGKCSPVHFFWGSFDLAVSRFSGRMAPPRPDADFITAWSYDEEVSSLGFWPGGEIPGKGVFDAIFYAYHTPKPDGYEALEDLVEGAYWEARLGEWVLPYAAVIASAHPATTLLTFAERTYRHGASLAGWDVSALTYPPLDRGPTVTFWPTGRAITPTKAP